MSIRVCRECTLFRDRDVVWCKVEGRMEETEEIKRWDGWEDMQPLYLGKARHGTHHDPKRKKERLSIF